MYFFLLGLEQFCVSYAVQHILSLTQDPIPDPHEKKALIWVRTMNAESLSTVPVVREKCRGIQFRRTSENTTLAFFYWFLSPKFYVSSSEVQPVLPVRVQVLIQFVLKFPWDILPQNSAMFRIRDILVRIRIRFCGSVPRIYWSGSVSCSRSCFFFNGLKDGNKKYIFSNFVCLLPLFEGTFTLVGKDKRS